MTKNLLLSISIALITYGCATLNVASDPTVGVWDYELHNLPRGEPIGELIITKNGDGHTVVMINPRNEFPLQEAAIEGNALVSGFFNSEGYKIDVTGTFEEDTFEGQIDAEGNTFRMTATKQE